MYTGRPVLIFIPSKCPSVFLHNEYLACLTAKMADWVRPVRHADQATACEVLR